MPATPTLTPTSTSTPFSPSTGGRYDVVLLDIEGTTTPIAYVHGVLFPYALQHLDAHLAATYDEEETQSTVRQLIHEAQMETQAENSGVLPIPESPIYVDASSSSSSSPPSFSPSYPLQLSRVCAHVRQLMSMDRKSTPLKALQGRMWRAGYTSGQLTAPLYPDVHLALPLWAQRGARLAIYSSGSEEAQRLIFQYTDRGDLSHLISAYHDTRVGAKQDADSYRRIMQGLGVRGERLLFLTDVEGEARACIAAGGHAMIVVREGNKPVDPACGIPLIHSFAEIELGP